MAAHAALDGLAGLAPRQPEDLLLRCRGVIRAVQGRGSGADVAASILGGVVAYRAEPCAWRRVAETLPLVAAYSGSKEKTAVVIAVVERLRAAHPEAVAAIFRAMDTVTAEGVAALESAAWPRVGAAMNMGQGLMDAIGVSNARLAAMVAALRGAAGIHGAKISGSGLGDCVIGLGTVAADAVLPFSLLPVGVSGKGVVYE